MRRRLLSILSWFLLTLSVAFGVLWLQAHFGGGFRFGPLHALTQAPVWSIGSGRVGIFFIHIANAKEGKEHQLSFVGFEWSQFFIAEQRVKFLQISLSHVTAMLVTLPLPLWWILPGNGERMRHRLLKYLSVLSLVLSLTTALTWMVSYWSYALVAREAYSGVGTELLSVSGKVIFYHFNSYKRAELPEQQWGATFISSSSRPGIGLQSEFNFAATAHWWNRLGFLAILKSPSQLGLVSFIVIAVPHWLLVAVFSALPTYHVVQQRKQRRIQGGLCPSCGYNLTANVSGICPECGTPIPD